MTITSLKPFIHMKKKIKENNNNNNKFKTINTLAFHDKIDFCQKITFF